MTSPLHLRASAPPHIIGKLVNMIIRPQPWLMPRRRQ
jgi:hypothetical protein